MRIRGCRSLKEPRGAVPFLTSVTEALSNDMSACSDLTMWQGRAFLSMLNFFAFHMLSLKPWIMNNLGQKQSLKGDLCISQCTGIIYST